MWRWVTGGDEARPGHGREVGCGATAREAPCATCEAPCAVWEAPCVVCVAPCAVCTVKA